MATRQQLEQQLVAAHRSGNVQAAQQAAYAIRQYDQSALSAQVPSINAPPPIERVPKPTFGSWLENVGIGIGEGLGEQVQGIGELAQRGVSALGAYAKDPLKASAAAFMGALAPAMRGFTQPVQTAKDVGAGVVETGKQMYQQATSGPVGLGQTLGQLIDMPGPDLPGGKRRPTMAELDVYHGTPHTFEPEEGAPLGRFRSSKIGTGEGAQAYGYGLYFAEDSNVAGSYKTTLSTRDKNRITLDGQRVDPDTMLGRSLEDLKKLGRQSALQKLDDNIRFNEKYAPDMAELYRSVRNKINTIDESKVSVKEGSLYKVDLPDAKIEQMLDWDKPLSEQSAAVKEALRKSPFAPDESVWDKWTGQQLYESEVRAMTDFDKLPKGSSRAFVSNALRQAGIPGIKYLDAGSRDGGKGTRNFVVFPGEEQNLTILERDGVKAEVPKPDAPVIDTTKPRREQLRQLHQQSGVSFVDSTIDRGGAHTPAGPTSGSPAYDVALNGTYPEDFYGANGLRYYGTGYDEMDKQAYDKIRRMEGRPNAPVEVYRAVEKNGPKTISPGDWVTTVRDYAKDHGESALNGDYKIIRALVNARDIYTAGDSMLEWGYHPQPRMPQLPKVAK